MPTTKMPVWIRSEYVTIGQPPFPQIRGQKLPPVGGQPPAVCWQRQGQNTTLFAAVQPRQDQEGPISSFLTGVYHCTHGPGPSIRTPRGFLPAETACSAIFPLTFPQVEGVL